MLGCLIFSGCANAERSCRMCSCKCEPLLLQTRWVLIYKQVCLCYLITPPCILHTYTHAASAGGTGSQRALKQMRHVGWLCLFAHAFCCAVVDQTTRTVTSSLPVWPRSLASRHHAIYFNLKTLQRICHAHINRLFGSKGTDGAWYVVGVSRSTMS